MTHAPTSSNWRLEAMRPPGCKLRQSRRIQAACLLDVAEQLDWWLRNDPALLKIPTQVGYFEPDFVYRRHRSGAVIMGILEIKVEVFWDGEGSDARIKASAACAWVSAIQAAKTKERWEFAVVLKQDYCEATTLEAMLAHAQRHVP